MESRPPLEDVALYLAEHLYPELIKNKYETRCCIATTRAAIEVFEYFGYTAKECTFSVHVSNVALIHELHKAMKAGQEYTELDQQALIDAGAFQIHIGDARLPVDPRNINSHLMVMASDGEYVLYLDPSIQMAHRPAKKLFVPRGMVFTPDEITERGYAFLHNGQTFFHYRPVEDDSYTTSPDWRSRKRHWVKAVGPMIRGIKGSKKQVVGAREEVVSETTA